VAETALEYADRILKYMDEAGYYYDPETDEVKLRDDKEGNG